MERPWHQASPSTRAADARANPSHLEDAPTIDEVRASTLRPGTVAAFEERVAKRLPLREQRSKLGAFWHTEVGPLNQVIHVYPDDDLQHRTAVRAALAQDTARQQRQGGQDLVVAPEAEIMITAPFMPPLGRRNYGTGNISEMRTATLAPGDIAPVLEGWGNAIAAREQFSPLAACWTSELGGLTTCAHTWVSKDLNERARVREDAREGGGQWPPQAGVRPVRQTNTRLIPASLSPVRSSGLVGIPPRRIPREARTEEPQAPCLRLFGHPLVRTPHPRDGCPLPRGHPSGRPDAPGHTGGAVTAVVPRTPRRL
jgi:NIPSNAP